MTNTHELLDKIVQGTKCKPGWSFRLAGPYGNCVLHITIEGVNNYDHTEKYAITHYHAVPIATYNEKSWKRWIHTQCMRTMTHEIGESLRFGRDEVRPFVPMHGPGEDPYALVEWRTEEEARTTQLGSLRKGPV